MNGFEGVKIGSVVVVEPPNRLHCKEIIRTGWSTSPILPNGVQSVKLEIIIILNNIVDNQNTNGHINNISHLVLIKVVIVTSKGVLVFDLIAVFEESKEKIQNLYFDMFFKVKLIRTVIFWVSPFGNHQIFFYRQNLNG